MRVALKDANYGIHGGIVIRALIKKKFLIQPEVLFNSNSVDYKVTELDNLTEQIKTEKFQYLDIPILLGVKLGPLRLMAGPEGHIFINNTSELTDFSTYKDKFDDMTISWLGGAGLDIWNLMLDVRYEGGLQRFGDHIRFGNQQFDFADRPSRWTFSVGFLNNSLCFMTFSIWYLVTPVTHAQYINGNADDTDNTDFRGLFCL